MGAPGKEGQAFMERVVYSSLGRARRRVRVRPGIGLDNGVVSLGNGRMMIVTVDPVSAIPPLGMGLSGWLSVHLIASDLTASGVDPEYAIFSYNFPPVMTQSEREEYVRSIGAECDRLGIAIVAGHTGTYPGGGYTVVGSGAMIGLAQDGRYLTPAMARPGDLVLMTKHAAIEATASLALSFPKFVEEKVGHRLAKRARSMIKLCTTVDDARAARIAGLGRGGVTSMHDATEGGVLGALNEMAAASMTEFVVDESAIRVPREVAEVCSAFELDPLSTMGEGALLITCSPAKAAHVMRALSKAGLGPSEVGHVRKGSGLTITDHSGRSRRYRGGRDQYWSAYESAVRRRLG